MSKNKKSTKTKTVRKKTTSKKDEGVYVIDAELGKIDISKPKTKAEAKKRDQEIKRRVNLQHKLHSDKDLAEKHPIVIEAKSKVADFDLDKLITPTTLANIAQAQKTLQAYANLHQNTFRQIAEMQENIMKAYTLPIQQLQESIRTITTFQDNIANIASMYQNVISDVVLNSGITQISNMLKSIRVEAFAGLYITSEFKDKYETQQNGILEVSTVKQSKLLASGQVRVDFDKST